MRKEDILDMEIKVVKLKDTAIMPTKGSMESAGYDLYVDIEEPVTIRPHETEMLMTNLAMEIPSGYFGAIYARSGLSTKMGLRPSTCVSVIDSDYRGNVGLPIHNDSNEERVVVPGERVAQFILHPVLDIDFVECESLTDTERGDNGFGSSGR